MLIVIRRMIYLVPNDQTKRHIQVGIAQNNQFDDGLMLSVAYSCHSWKIPFG